MEECDDSSNAHIVSNDDGSGFEAIYKSRGEVSSYLTSFFTSSNIIHSSSTPLKSKANQSMETYSLDGSYALDNTNNTGDLMLLGRVLALNEYECEHLESPDLASQCNESASLDVSMYS